MKKSSKLITMLATLSLLVVGGGVLGSTNFASAPVETEAAVVNSGNKIVWATSDNSNWTTANSVTKLHYWGGDADTVIAADYSYAWNAGSNYKYYRFSVPINATHIQFVRYSSDGSSDWNWAAETTDVQYGVMYYIWDSNSDWNFKTSAGTVKDNFPVEAFAKAVEGVQTCSNSTVNGYPLYSNLNNNFYSRLVAGADLSAVTINDYSYQQYVDAGGNYSNIQGDPATSVSVLNKWNAIKAQYDAHNSGANISGAIAVEPAITTLIVVSIVGVTAVGAFFFYRKKKLIR